MDNYTLFSSFDKWVKPIYHVNFQQRVEELRQDKYTKKLTTEAYLLLFLHAQCQQRDGLRSIADDLLNEEFQLKVGLKSISPSQLSRKNNQMDPTILSTIFFELVSQIQMQSSPSHSRHRFKVIDSSTISLCMQKYEWAAFRSTKAGVKLHLRLAFVDEQNVYPEKMVFTTAKPHDRTQMDNLIDETGVMYVFDRGYVDYKKWDSYCENGIFFASRIKQNAVYHQIESFKVQDASPILSDSMIALGNSQKRMEHVLRLIETTDTKGNPLKIVTNRFALTAEEVGDMYRSRWAIELFFKWVKQHVKIKSFYGTSEAAVENQIYLALITYCLFVLVQQETNSECSYAEILRWFKVLMWKPFEKWVWEMKSRPVARKRE